MSPNKVEIYPYHTDIVTPRALVDVFHRSVHSIPDVIYSAEQKSAWAPNIMDVSSWRTRLGKHSVWVALDEKNKECLGFIEVDEKGDIECLYICPTAQGQGIAKSLLQTVREFVQAHFPEKKEWHVGASDAAYEFFLKQGFMPAQRNRIERFGVILENTTMVESFI